MVKKKADIHAQRAVYQLSIHLSLFNKKAYRTISLPEVNLQDFQVNPSPSQGNQPLLYHQ